MTLERVFLIIQWMACGLQLMYLHLSERVMKKFEYIYGIIRASTLSALLSVTRKDINVIFEGFYDHMVPMNVRCMLAPQ